MWRLSVWQSVILFFLISPVLVTSRKGERDEYETTYACEGRHLRISCTGGKQIRLVRANYGRFSMSICNDKGVVDWSVSCMSYWSFPIMKDRCSQKSSCSIHVSSETFEDDPCPGTVKYLEVQYHCIPPNSHSGSIGAEESIVPVVTTPIFPQPNNTYFKPGDANIRSEKNNTTNRVNIVGRDHEPSPLPSSTSSSVSRTLASVRKTTTSTTSTTTTSSTSTTTITSIPFLPPYFKSNVFEDYNDESDLKKPTSVISSPIPFTPHKMCPPIYSRDLRWNWTRAGEIAVQKCPGGATGLARWKCDEETVSWTPDQPNLNECKSIWVDNLRERMQGGDSITSITSEMALMTLSKVLFSKDVSHVVTIIKQTLSRAVDSMENFLDMWHRRQVFKELLESIVETVSNLLGDKQNEAWKDLTSSECRQVTSDLLQGLEEGALLLSESLTQESSFIMAKTNVLMLVEAVDVRKTQNLVFPLPTQVPGSSWVRVEDSLLLPTQSLVEYSNHGLARVVLRLYNKVDELLRPDANFHSHVTRGQDITNGTWVINSRVVAASVGRRRFVRLLEPVQITFKHLQEENVTNPQCVFWDIKVREWSGEGCWTVASNSSHTTCACNHFTNFALIMEVKHIQSPSAKTLTLQLVTSLGCAICVIFLLLTAVSLYVLRGPQTDRTTIHKNLCLCLLVAELVFAAGINQTHLQALCGLVAGLLHYLFLVVFVWMFLDGFHLYVLLVEVYDSEKTRARWYYAMAYSVPIVIVAVSAIIDPQSYGTSEYCWLRSDNYFIFSFVGPAVGILFGSTVFLCIATCIMCHQTSISTVVKGKEEAKLTNIKVWIRWAIVILCLLGLTWTAGLLYVNEGTDFLAYIFTVLNCILGLFVFVFYCLQNEHVKEDLSKFMQRYEWLPKCFLPATPNEQSRNEIPGRVTMPTNLPPSQHSVPQHLRNTQVQNCFISPKFTIQDHLSTSIVVNQDDTLQTPVPVIGSLRRKGHRDNGRASHIGILSSVSRASSPGHYGFEANHHQSGSGHQLFQVVPCNRKPAYAPYSDSSGVYSVFADHIYESIEDDTRGRSNNSEYGRRQSLTKQSPPAENYYGDHSDLSQHSSSSGYDQRPLLVTSTSEKPHPTTSNQLVYGFHLTHDNYSLASTPELSRQPKVDKIHGSTQRSSNCDRIPNVHMFNTASPKLNHEFSIESYGNQNHLATEIDPEDWSPVLPDLLRSPPDNVVMAVLDGEKVVNRLHADMGFVEDARNQSLHKRSTYC
ncbi:latrophilin Cirl-like isoform X2 [Limulus polyphemus]|uniref:Latrophilin Cirl-like isoform X2 n=1 Tax=Limulus polyphemus TaxID=6850 RepID=A0ABM1SPH3_LIMPO|nr:latrophilin Cirl-like isoform X2 [Limulus polyphemus]